MCFSAGASFTSGVLLAFVGTETLRKVHKPSQIVFAGIPLFFAFQQFAEGVLWTAMAHTGYSGLRKTATYVFVIMARVIWPLLIPLSVLLMEENKIRKRILFALLGAGAAVALYHLYCLILYSIHAEISSRHIAYHSVVQDSLGKIALFVYLAATIVPLFISSIKRMYILCVIMAISFMVSAVFYTRCLTSVWCFFAAVMSFVIFYIVRDAHKKFLLK